MSEKKIIAVVGATGAQGGSLVRAIQADVNGEFRARAIVREPDSDKAKALAELGAEIVVGDLDDPGSIERAFEGAYGAFCVTFYWSHFSPEKEAAHARVMADAAKKAAVKHVIWSTLEDTRKYVPLSDGRMPTLMENYKVPHFDEKGAADEYFVGLGLPVTLLATTFYWDNLVQFGMGPKAGPDGNLVFALPMGDAKLSGIAAEDIGKCAYGVFKAGDRTIGTTVGIAGEHLTGADMAASLSRALGRTVTYQAIPHDVYRSFGFPGADDLGNMFQFYTEFEESFTAKRDLAFARSLNPELQSFDAWLAVNASSIKIE